MGGFPWPAQLLGKDKMHVSFVLTGLLQKLSDSHIDIFVRIFQKNSVHFFHIYYSLPRLKSFSKN